MVRRSLFARCLVWILILSCAHAPFPFSDGVEQAVGKPAGTEDKFDVDFILLGADLPDDVDDGPIDDDPEQSATPFGDYYLIANAQPNNGIVASSHFSCKGIVHLYLPRMALPVSNAQRPDSQPLRSFGVSFTISTPQAWRELLSVFLI